MDSATTLYPNTIVNLNPYSNVKPLDITNPSDLEGDVTLRPHK